MARSGSVQAVRCTTRARLQLVAFAAHLAHSSPPLPRACHRYCGTPQLDTSCIHDCLSTELISSLLGGHFAQDVIAECLAHLLTAASAVARRETLSRVRWSSESGALSGPSMFWGAWLLRLALTHPAARSLPQLRALLTKDVLKALVAYVCTAPRSTPGRRRSSASAQVPGLANAKALLSHVLRNVRVCSRGAALPSPFLTDALLMLQVTQWDADTAGSRAVCDIVDHLKSVAGHVARAKARTSGNLMSKHEQSAAELAADAVMFKR